VVYYSIPFNSTSIKNTTSYDVDFDWAEDCESNDCTRPGNEKMDFENIVTHELGHSVGLDDLFTEACSEETMYGFAAEGKINKRTLDGGGITGIIDLYN
jgi:hypothetical protein